MEEPTTIPPIATMAYFMIMKKEQVEKSNHEIKYTEDKVEAGINVKTIKRGHIPNVHSSIPSTSSPSASLDP